MTELRKLLIPPKGASKKDVDAVYGKPRVVEWREGMKGQPSRYPLRVYDLLPPNGRAEFRAFLHVTFREDRVVRAGINHATVIKGRRAGVPGQDAELRAERRRVLADLEEIRRTYWATLREAAWSRGDDAD